MSKYTYHTNGTLPDSTQKWCFVFGSNLKGIHGAGSALVAKQHFGAQLGKGIGLSPNNTSYAIPTKSDPYTTLTLEEIQKHVETFKQITYTHPELNFWITAVGTGLAGYTHSQIAPLFKHCNTNVSFPVEWKEFLETHTPHIYTGIGSRQTPNHILDLMRDYAVIFGQLGYTLRSGGAPGADTAFEEGCDISQGLKEIYLPWKNFNNNKSIYLPGKIHFELASTIHPVWEKLSRGAQALHARNTAQILGITLHTPSKFVLCYTEDGATTAQTVSSKTGGTGTAIKLASLNNIPVFNLKNKDTIEKLETFLSTLD